MTNAMILEQRSLSDTWQLLTLATPDLAGAQPAQFVMLKTTFGASLDPLLRQCAWIVASDKRQTISLMLDRRTTHGALLASLPHGMELDLIGAFGRPLTLPTTKQTTLLIAEAQAIEAVLLYAQRASQNGHPVMLLASSADADRVPAWVLPPDVEYLATDGDVLDLIDARQKLENPLNWANRLIAAGSHDLASRLVERIKRERFRWQPGFASMILHDHFTCGVGLCGDCWVSTKHGDKLACSQGAWFDLRDVA
ncbi:MAG: hypothetical protein KAX40_05295 [Herpetosiphon sp.]|nr:hypothetical protein [Herpetosiphon sp.]